MHNQSLNTLGFRLYLYKVENKKCANDLRMLADRILPRSARGRALGEKNLQKLIGKRSQVSCAVVFIWVISSVIIIQIMLVLHRVSGIKCSIILIAALFFVCLALKQKKVCLSTYFSLTRQFVPLTGSNMCDKSITD